MTKSEFNILNQFILENLEKKNPFIITTTRLFKVINYDIHLRTGHNALYNDFLKFCEELRPPYNVNHAYRFENSDEQFDIEFYK